MTIKEPLKNTHTFKVNNAVIITTRGVKEAIEVYKYAYGDVEITSITMDGEEVELE